MKAIVQDRYGTSTVLENRQIDTPQIESRQVLIRVRAAGVNPADWAVMNGLPYIARPLYGLTRPKAAVRGTDVAGVVERIGPDVTRFRVGDEVFGSANGSYAEYATAEEDGLALKPTNLDFRQAATVPMAGLVALQALRDHADVRPGQRVLINGASGGIGTFAVQIAKALGAEVTAVCGTGNLDLVRSLGADHVVDYTEVDFTRTGETYDVILDNVGNHSLSQTRRALAA
jgi:NADPH:quinone reductase-like Zn-dependent oxidoreductase